MEELDHTAILYGGAQEFLVFRFILFLFNFGGMLENRNKKNWIRIEFLTSPMNRVTYLTDFSCNWQKLKPNRELSVASLLGLGTPAPRLVFVRGEVW